MNRIYSLLIFIAVTFSAKAQQYQLDSIVHTVQEKQFVTIQNHDIDKQRAEIIRFERNKNSSEKKFTERINIRYNNHFKNTQHIYSLWNSDGNNWLEYEKTEEEYNAENKLIGQTSYRKQGKEWRMEYQHKKTYAKDTLIETDYEYRNNKFQPVIKSLTFINSFDKVKYYETLRWNDTIDDWKKLSQTRNVYQNDTILIAYEVYEWKDNQWKNQEKVTYELDKNNQRTDNYTVYLGVDSEWIPKNKFEQIELTQERKKLSKTYTWSEEKNDWILSTQVDTYLNDKGEKQDVIYSELDKTTNQLKPTLERMHFYDDQNRLTLFQEIYPQDEKIVGTQNTVKFDEEGNVYREDFFELNAETDQWKEKTSTEFLFDKNILLPSTEERKKLDFFNLNEHNYLTNKYAVKQVKTYQYKNGEKVLFEEYEYFYSEGK